MNPRPDGKRLIGAQASPELWAGVDEWLRRNPRATVTDFVLSALLEKLSREQIDIDQNEVLRDRRSRLPQPANPPAEVRYTIPRSATTKDTAKAKRKA